MGRRKGKKRARDSSEYKEDNVNGENGGSSRSRHRRRRPSFEDALQNLKSHKNASNISEELDPHYQESSGGKNSDTLFITNLLGDSSNHVKNIGNGNSENSNDLDVFVGMSFQRISSSSSSSAHINLLESETGEWAIQPLNLDIVAEESYQYDSLLIVDSSSIIRHFDEFCGETLTVIGNMLELTEFFHLQAVCKSWNFVLKNIKCIESISLSNRDGDVSKLIKRVKRRFKSVKELKVGTVFPYKHINLSRPQVLRSFLALRRLDIDLDFRGSREFESFWKCVSQLHLVELKLAALPYDPQTSLDYIPGLTMELDGCFYSFETHLVDTIRLLPHCDLDMDYHLSKVETLYYKPREGEFWHVKESESKAWFAFERSSIGIYVLHEDEENDEGLLSYV
jgi:hypothetical protein